MKNTKNPKVCLAILTFFLVFVSTVSAKIIYVDDDGLADYTTIQAAIDAAVDGDVVVVADGTYTGGGNREIDFRGKRITVKSENGPEYCIIDCQNAGRAFRFTNYENSESILDGFSITNGTSSERGAGIYCYRSHPTIANCIISESRCSKGGGICCYRGSSPTILDCVIMGNYGSGIYCHEGSPKITNTEIIGNSGSGIFSNEADTIITNCNIVDNFSSLGGGIHCYRSSRITITNCTISGNSASHYGGGIFCYENSSATITNCVLWNNTASEGKELALIPAGSSSSIATLSYSDVQGGEMAFLVQAPCKLNWGTGNISVYPSFVSSDNFHLRFGSPCINAGDPDKDYSGQTDIDGQPRVMEGLVDMGADEFIYQELPALIGLVIDGPSEVVEDSSAQYTVVASYEDGSILNMNAGAIWSVEHVTYASINENALLRTERVDKPQDIIIHVQYSEGGITFEAEKNVLIYLSNILYVPADYETIQEAINAAEHSDRVFVADGTYTGEGNRDIDFLGKAITVKSEYGPQNCIIDCQGAGRGFYFHSGEDEKSILDGFTIINGRTGEYRYGGGISCRNTAPTIHNCILSNNIAANQGGGIAGGYATISNCIIKDKSPSGIWGDRATIKNCVISGNAGEGVKCWQGNNTKIINCLITGNSSYGISCFLGAVTIKNSVVWGNAYSEISSRSSTTSISYSNIQGGYGSEGNIDADPCFVDPGYWDANGFWIDGDYHLLPESLCIDAGDPDYIAEPNETDLDGNPRVMGGRIDMGAYEAPIFAEARILPQTINLASKGNWITAYIWLPEDYNVTDIDPNSILLEDEIKPTEFSVDEQQQVATARFTRHDVQPIFDLGEVELTITGQLNDGTVFEGTDTIKVIDKAGKKEPGF